MAVVATNPKCKVQCLNLPVPKKRRFSSIKNPLSNPTMSTRSAFLFHVRFIRFRSLASSSVLKRKKKHRDPRLIDQEETKVDDVKTIQVSTKRFLPLNEEEKVQVEHAFSVINRKKVLVSHENSNLDINGKTLQCLMPTAWLNDEIVNLYLELLKEREARDPIKYLKCHFFNSFFYTKLLGCSGSNYDYQVVRRWTTKKKLGYDLIDCHIICVPIHKGTHWTLAVINIKERKFMYLDSLAKAIPTKILNALEDMPYFRLRTAKEILRLQAD